MRVSGACAVTKNSRKHSNSKVTNGATSEGIAQCHCTVYLTLSLTLVPTRDCRVYEGSLSGSVMRVNNVTKNKTGFTQRRNEGDKLTLAMKWNKLRALQLPEVFHN